MDSRRRMPPLSSLYDDAEAELQRLLDHITGGRCGGFVSEILNLSSNTLTGSFPPVPDFLIRLIDGLPAAQQHRDRVKYLFFTLLSRHRRPIPPVHAALSSPPLPPPPPKRKYKDEEEEMLLLPGASQQAATASPKRKCKEAMVVDPPLLLLPMDSQQAGTDSPKKQCEEVVDPLSEMLAVVRGFATGAAFGGGIMAIREAQGQIILTFRARHAMFVKKDVANSEELPYAKRRRPKKSLFKTSRSSEQDKGTGSQEIQQPVQRSRRTLSLLSSGKPQKRIPIGDDFQADVPEWTGLLNEESEESRLGFKIWPTEMGADTDPNKKMIGEGRSDSCTCNHQGSVECIKLHITNLRMLLRSYLGEAFSSLGFDTMGEGVAESWTHEEQTKFDEFVKLNPPSQGNNFMETALDSFPTKSSRDIASYYYNVYVLRRIREQTRSQSRSVDSDVEDESNATTKVDGKKRITCQTSYTRQSQRRLSKKASVKEV